ncbi:MAG: arginine--tRNA ligase [Phycisphaerales bacterium]|jgi:arginyl-tRNA synthetase|nr:arginine--tRNA ligase [Phycisphaerales bacterium]
MGNDALQTGPLDPVDVLAERFLRAIRAAFPDLGPDPVDPAITPSKQPKLGDFQCNAAMALGKRLGKNPREVAQAIVQHVELSDLCEPLGADAIAGPGFINLRLRPDALSSLLTRMDAPGLGVPAPASPETVVVDLCGINLAKQMHVGHLRATIIGDAIARILERLGNRVVRQNHVGDWGLPIAMVVQKLREESGAGRIDLDRLTLDDLDRLYREAQRDCAADARGLACVTRFDLGPKARAELEEQVASANDAMARAKATLVALQAHDAQTVALWTRITDVTMRECLLSCERLHANVSARDSAGESSYATELAPLIEDLASRGIAEVSEGALVVRNEGIAEPTLVRKSDGGFLYATTDLAAIRRRVQKIGASRVIYTVDARQALHFKQVFASAHKAGFTARPDGTNARLEHAAFGTVLGEDGRPFKTRSGENVKLASLIDESIERATARIGEKNADLSPEERRTIGAAVGVAAIKYADLSNDRVRDYQFSFDRMLEFEGNTGPYLLYAVVRLRSIFRNAKQRGLDAGWQGAPIAIDQPAEKNLALALLRYPGVVRGAGDALEPHRVCVFAFELATAFSSFFDACPVLAAPDDATRRSRLRLCDLTLRVLEDALHTVGIPTIERM